MVLGLIDIFCVFILFLDATGLNLGFQVENRNACLFGWLSRSNQTRWWFGESPIIASYLILNIELGSLNFPEIPHFTEFTL